MTLPSRIKPSIEDCSELFQAYDETGELLQEHYGQRLKYLQNSLKLDLSPVTPEYILIQYLRGE